MQKEEELWILKMMLLHIYVLKIKISITKKMSLCKKFFLDTHYSLQVNVLLSLSNNSFIIYVIVYFVYYAGKKDIYKPTFPHDKRVVSIKNIRNLKDNKEQIDLCPLYITFDTLTFTLF